MKKFTKILSGVLALAMVGCMSISAFAAEVNKEIQDVERDNTATQDVNVVANDAVKAGTVYYVTIKIPDLSFTYNAINEGSWNQETLKYTGATAAGWQGGTATETAEVQIEVKNRSNASVKVTPVYAAEETVGDGLDGDFGSAEEGVTLTSAAPTDVVNGTGLETTSNIPFKVTGTPTNPQSLQSSTKVGTVTLTVTAAPVV